MTKNDEIYKCNICGNVVSVILAGDGDLVCCDEPMELLEPKSVEQEGKEKHVPVIETTDGGIRVKVGDVPHPMEEKHYIGLIQVLKDGKILVGKRLNPGEEPVAEFCLANTEGLSARAWCNIHGLWLS
jgi:superoxide reductase